MDDERLAAAPDRETFPGHAIYPYRGVDYEEAALHLESRHRRGVLRAAEAEPDRTAALLLDACERLIGQGHFRYDMPGWRAALFADADFPLFLRLTLRNPKLTHEDVRQLYAGLSQPRRAEVRLAVLVAIGYPVDRQRNQVGNQLGNEVGKEESKGTKESSAEKNEVDADKQAAENL